MKYLISLVCLVLLALTAVPACATVIRVDTPVGHFYVDLLEEEAPATVANFLSYLRDGSYDNSIIHRSSHGFIVQGGGFTFTDDAITAIPEKAPVVNEFGASNTRGTVAMAKIADDPDSATSQWFINADDNSANLDNQNGGFTVFGRVLGNGMAIVDLLNSIVRFNLDSGALSEIPLLISGAIENVQAKNIVFTQVTEVTGFEINSGLTGAWFNPATPGQGWLIDVIDNGERKEIFVAWFTWEVASDTARSIQAAKGFASDDNRWLTAGGSFDGDSATLTLSRSTGGAFNDPRATGLETVGTLSAQFIDCANAIFSWNFDNDDFPDDSVEAIRLSPDAFCGEIALPLD